MLVARPCAADEHPDPTRSAVSSAPEGAGPARVRADAPWPSSAPGPRASPGRAPATLGSNPAARATPSPLRVRRASAPARGSREVESAVAQREQLRPEQVGRRSERRPAPRHGTPPGAAVPTPPAGAARVSSDRRSTILPRCRLPPDLRRKRPRPRHDFRRKDDEGCRSRASAV